MMDRASTMDWPVVSLADVCDLVPGFAFKSSDFGNYPDRVIKIKDIQPPFVDFTDLEGVDLSKYKNKNLEKYIVHAGDYVFAMTGATIGKVGIITSGTAYINQRVLVFRPKQDLCDKRFLYYTILNQDFLPFVMNHIDSQSVQPNISATTVGRYQFTLPPLSIQKRIADILSSLDDKIEVNNQINRNLEEQAKAIFKSWFVDFEPFQDGEFVDSELGKIPKGWKVSDIYNSASVIYGAPFSSSMFNAEKRGKLIVRIRDLATELPQIYTEEKHPKGYLIQPGDIVVGMDGEFRAHIWGGEEAWLNQRVCVFKPKESFSPAFVLYSIMPLLAAVEASEVATTVIHLGKNDIDKFRIIIPEKEVLLAFNSITSSLYYSIVQNKIQTRCLTSLRDTLLPKLMSEEIKTFEEISL